ncbi:RNase H domain-containing protein [Trichonephila clavipes]|nr:RNase H domain-containing protein [Trichonephila clavipes]
MIENWVASIESLRNTDVHDLELAVQDLWADLPQDNISFNPMLSSWIAIFNVPECIILQCVSTIGINVLVLEAHGFTRQDQTLLALFRSGHIKSMKFSEGRKIFEMCTNCSSEPATPAHIVECLGLTKQDFADVPVLVLDYLKVYNVSWTWSSTADQWERATTTRQISF